MRMNSTLARFYTSWKLGTSRLWCLAWFQSKSSWIPLYYKNKPILASGLLFLDNPEVVCSVVVLVPDTHSKILAAGQISSFGLAQVIVLELRTRVLSHNKSLHRFDLTIFTFFSYPCFLFPPTLLHPPQINIFLHHSSSKFQTRYLQT